MNKTKKIIIYLTINLALLFIFLSPSISQAALVPCGVTDTRVLAEHPSYAEPCEFRHFMDLINIVIRFILVDLAVPIAASMFFYAGFAMVTSGGSTEARSKAKSIFSSTAIGLIIVVVAWLVIRTLLSILGYDGAWIGL